MRWLAFALLLQAAAAAPPPVAPLADPSDALIGRWSGTWTTTQIGDCTMDGTDRRVQDVQFEAGREDDGTLRAGIWPGLIVGPGLPLKAAVVKNKLRVELPKTIICGQSMRRTTERLIGDLPKREGDRLTLRLTGDSTTCIAGNCRFRQTYVLSRKAD